jgi:NADH:ubiquinone oxidoreductase subunit E
MVLWFSGSDKVAMSKHDKPRKVEKLADRPCLAVCAGKHCAKAGTKHILRAAHAALAEAGLDGQVVVELTKCQDFCDDAPAVTVLPGPYPYIDLTPMAVQQIILEHLARGRPLRSLLHKHARRRLDKTGS